MAENVIDNVSSTPDGNIAIDFGNVLGSVADGIAAAWGSTFGSTPAQASSYSVHNAGGMAVGVITIPGMSPGFDLQPQLLGIGAYMDPSGAIFDLNGQPAGLVDVTTNHGFGLTVGPLNVEAVSFDYGTVATPTWDRQ
jgi:hypothetical protein